MDLSGLETEKQIELTALKVIQPLGDFYIASISSSDLYNLSYFDIRQIYNEGGIDQYLGIQRIINERRVKEIRQYIGTIDATFPTAVILAVDERCAKLTKVECEELPAGSPVFRLTLRNIPNPDEGEDPVLFKQIARVIDGQHRIQGLAEYAGPDFQINVAVFIGLDIAAQASVFSVVNLAQTKVNSSLVYDLFAYDKARSPEKTCHELAVGLDLAPSSPFHERIKRLGVATDGRFGETLSQATFVRALLPYLTDDVMRDRDIGRRHGRYPVPTASEARRQIFRLPFVRNNDEDIGATIWAYFGAVADKWPDAWNAGGTGIILNKTTGFQALMRFLRPAFLSVSAPGGVPNKDQFRVLFDRVSLAGGDFNTDNFKPGSSGVGALTERLLVDTDVQRV